MRNLNEVTHWKEVNLFGIKKIGFLEWQCVLASVVGGLSCFVWGLSLEMFYIYGDHSKPAGPLGLFILIESNAVLHTYYNFVAWLLPWALMIGAFTMYRKYAPLRNLFWTFLVLTFSKRSSTPVIGEFSDWLWAIGATILSLTGIWGFFGGTIDTLKDWYFRFSRHAAKPA